MGNEIEMKNFISLEYPEDFLVVVFDPSSKELLMFPDAVDILLESLGYELFYFIPFDSQERKKEAYLIYKSRLDSSFLRIKSEFYFVPFETSLDIPLVNIKECYLVGDGYEENVTRDIKNFVELYPKKIDLFSLLGLDFEEKSYLHLKQFQPLNKKFGFNS